MVFQKTLPLELLRRRGSGLLMPRRLYPSFVFWDFSLKNLVSISGKPIYVLSRTLIFAALVSRISFRLTNTTDMIQNLKKIQHDQPLDLPPKPPQKRNWVGSTIPPFAGNNMLISCHCPGNDSNGIIIITSEGCKSKLTN